MVRPVGAHFSEPSVTAKAEHNRFLPAILGQESTGAVAILGQESTGAVAILGQESTGALCMHL